MDGQFSLNFEAVFKHIDRAETFSIALPIIKRALVIDMRSKDGEPPLVRVMPMARSANERLRSLKRMRPQLPRPSEMLVVPWASYVDGLVRSGLWAKVRARVGSAGSKTALTALDQALDDLRAIESREVAALLRGERYETLWARKS